MTTVYEETNSPHESTCAGIPVLPRNPQCSLPKSTSCQTTLDISRLHTDEARSLVLTQYGTLSIPRWMAYRCEGFDGLRK